MAKKILLITSNSHTLGLTRHPLQDEGYRVITARDGTEGLSKARSEQPNLVIVDFGLDGTDGNEVVRRLKTDPATEHQPVLMIADQDQIEDLEIGRADDLLIKPFSTVELITRVTPLVISEEERRGTVISTGNGELDSKMGGGIPLGSLTLIEGDSGAGKSVLSQQMMHGCLEDGYKVTLFTSEDTVKSLVKQMRSLNLDIMDYLLLDKLRILPIATARLGRNAPAALIRAMKQEKGRDMIFVDSLTSSIPHSSDREVLTFFEECKRLSGQGISVIVVVHSHGLRKDLLTRLRSLCDAHLQLRTEEMGNKLVKTLEVTKVRGAEQTTGNIITFEVEPGWGMRVIPMSKVKA